ncbi:TetR/AcrR family transcriptional regulator [Nocardia huaxiensis]|uniref:TetR/AcrR family transcriptional regulator n=1 Tax=Nocardia huaxiensis TaxID=2755382 RepID=A0A7D6Z226_9NOCA|nr:TetR/AcrR family transcriptional regulator [Nocardia huaxiensis]QLY28864.1 TetR/AcrR family transcriptional regulator [Nocardia huaxiensis]UFS97660.1 TetR/AcrR family transcriptional regulator [Nocardia huaxiensis]
MAGRPGRRDQILETFIRHVAERGYNQTNLGDIANELGMSKGTIVHHFGTKAQMLRELEDNYMSQRKRELKLVFERLESPAERVAAMIYAGVFYQIEDRDATIASQREFVQLTDDPEMLKIREHRSDVQRMMQQEIRAGMDAGVFRELDEALATLQIFGSMQWMWTWFNPKGRRTPDEVGAAFVDLALGGLLIDRFMLTSLADPKGRLPKIVHECMQEAAAH